MNLPVRCGAVQLFLLILLAPVQAGTQTTVEFTSRLDEVVHWGVPGRLAGNADTSWPAFQWDLDDPRLNAGAVQSATLTLDFGQASVSRWSLAAGENTDPRVTIEARAVDNFIFEWLERDGISGWRSDMEFMAAMAQPETPVYGQADILAGPDAWFLPASGFWSRDTPVSYQIEFNPAGVEALARAISAGEPLGMGLAVNTESEFAFLGTHSLLPDLYDGLVDRSGPNERRLAITIAGVPEPATQWIVLAILGFLLGYIVTRDIVRRT